MEPEPKQRRGRAGSVRLDVYAGGGFRSIGGQRRHRLAALDTRTGTATPWNPNADNDVNAVAVSGSTVYAGGYFTSISGEPRHHVAALDAR